MIDKQGFTFYPNAWLEDKRLKHCSLQAKGMWIDLLCHMHKGDPYGYLIFNGKVLSVNDIQKLLKVSNNNVFNTAWNELLNKQIIVKDNSNGAFYSKKMQKEHGKQKKRKEDIVGSSIYPLVKEIVDHLNWFSGRSYPADNVDTFCSIERWIKEGHSVRDFKIVNEIKTLEWKDTDKMASFIRPSTLYGDKFLNYLNQNPNHRLSEESGQRKWTIKDYFHTPHTQQTNNTAQSSNNEQRNFREKK